MSEAELVDALFGEAAPPLRAHAESCEACGAKLRALQGGVSLAREADVPEPSPLYWEAFRRQVGRRIDGADQQLSRWRLWPVLAAAATLVVALSLSVRGPQAPAQAPDAPAAPPASWQPLPPVGEDIGLVVLESAFQGHGDLGVIEDCGGYANCLARLSDTESQQLLDALRGSMVGRLAPPLGPTDAPPARIARRAGAADRRAS